ncbi:AAA family ATPase [Luteococcus peritonei]|uniref:AAA family ATPase n=1 Tax=Luteococcus peritonei TaxID=88874 RepID=A0ABW4RUP7_9ACTN
MITTVAVEGFRSLRSLVLELGQVTLVTGANGSGKSSLYRALSLLADTAQGSMIASLARQGGLQSVLWAGPEQISHQMRIGEVPVQGKARRVKPVSLQLGFATEELGYMIDVGLPTPRASLFDHDPEIKRELVFAVPLMRPASLLVRRKNAQVDVNDDGWRRVVEDLPSRLSMLGELADPTAYPELLGMRQEVRSWRFYDSFRTDATAPARQPQVTTWTPVMAGDGADLLPALGTVMESAFAEPLHQAIASAFPGGELRLFDQGRRLELAFHQHGLLRPLSGEELSDGTLRFLLLAAALLSPRPPGLLVLNEPETSLHPDVLPALADLVVAASRRTQVVVVSHSPVLADRMRAGIGEGLVHVELVKDTGETVVAGREGLLDQPAWNWGHR